MKSGMSVIPPNLCNMLPQIATLTRKPSATSTFSSKPISTVSMSYRRGRAESHNSPGRRVRDVRYGPLEVQNLRKETPDEALNNADTYMWFALVCPFLIHHPSATCISITISHTDISYHLGSKPTGPSAATRISNRLRATNVIAVRRNGRQTPCV